MSFLKFNKAELVNLSYSLKREILGANKTGAYFNTTIVNCNTRRYHALLAVTLDRFGGGRFILLSDLDESLVISGKQFNIGIHCYGDVYEPRGHKYVIDFDAVPIPQITYSIGGVKFRKSYMLVPDRDQLLVKYEVLESNASVKLKVKPFLSFRNSNDLTHRNDVADTSSSPVQNGISCCMYEGFPSLNLQMSRKNVRFAPQPDWYMNVTYSDEYRRGFDCREDLFTPGTFEAVLKPGESIVFSASIEEEKASGLSARFSRLMGEKWIAENYRDQMSICADRLVTNHNGRLKICAGLSWMGTGLLRETLQSVAGLTLYGLKDPALFEAVIDNLIEDNQERFFSRTTQVEAPLRLACVLQHYISSYGAEAARIWKKYGGTMRRVIESYMPGVRREVAMHPNGMLWAQVDGVALSWMNAYVEGRPVTERAGYQVETNALWYNAICFAVEMERRFHPENREFISFWDGIASLIKANFKNMFWCGQTGCLADYVGACGQNTDIRPNQLYAIWVDNSPLDEECYPSIMRVVENELVTSRGIRTLSPRDSKYRGVYEGSQVERDLSYHNGSTRIFLLDVYVGACFKMRGASFLKKAEWLIKGFYEDLNKHGVGCFSELYDGDPPHEPHGAISSARSTAALLNIENMMDKYKEGAK